MHAEEGGDWSALLQHRPLHNAFVDVYSPQDSYPLKMLGSGIIFVLLKDLGHLSRILRYGSRWNDGMTGEILLFDAFGDAFGDAHMVPSQDVASRRRLL